jgi:type IV pilus assembly protein PilW
MIDTEYRPLAQAPRRQRGFTLIELMIALLIGLFLLGGLMTLVQDNRRSFSTQNQLSQLQDAERLAMTIMTDVIQAAGYFPDPTSNTATSSLPVVGALTAGQFMVGTYNAVAPGDTITARYATTTGDGILNCSGSSNTTGNIPPTLYTNVFSVLNGQLVCTMNGTAYPLVGTAPGAPGTASGIVVYNLSILYGVNSTGVGSNVDSYVNASAVSNWNNVISVQITLTFQNPLWSATVQGQGTQPQYLTFQRVVGVMNQTGIQTS